MRIPTAKGSDLASGGDQYVDVPGLYHFLIDQVKVGLTQKDEPQDGSTVEMTCLAGDDAGQVGRKCNVTLWDLDESKSADDQKQAIKRLTNFFIAVNQIQPTQLGAEVDVKPEEAAGHQIMLRLGHKQKKVTENGKTKWIDDPESKFLQIAYSDIFHVDDPSVAKAKKDVKTIGLIPAQYRHTGAEGEKWFGFKAKAGAGSNPAKSSDFDDDDDF
jgi:hypothetical protein